MNVSPLLKRARLAVLTIFFVNGAVLASWIAYIPTVKERMALSESTLAFVLLSAAVGALVSMPLTGVLIPRWGSRRVTRAATVFYCLLLLGPLLAPTLPGLILALFAFGALQGAMDVAMNAQAVAVEDGYDRPIMSTFHGFWSVGGLTGASLGGLALAVGLPPGAHALGIIVLVGGAGLYALRFLPLAHDEEDVHAFALPRGPLLLLGLLAFFALVAEGAVADWSGVYLREGLGVGAGFAAFGYAAFSLTMMIGRFTGDKLVQTLGPAQLIRLSAALGALGLGLGLGLHHPLAALFGFACAGLGVANLIPIFFSAAGRVPGVNAGTGIAAVSTTGYFGFLAGPPAIGLTAEMTGLRWALFIIVGFFSVIALLAHTLKPARGADSEQIGPRVNEA